MPPQKEADGRLYNLEKLEADREIRLAQPAEITVPVENTGRLLNSTSVTARYGTGRGGETLLAFLDHTGREKD